MNLTWLGWAGVEIEAEGATVVIDPLVDAGADGVNVAEGFARHELAAADASWIDDGAFALTVAFPLKSHDVAARFVIS